MLLVVGDERLLIREPHERFDLPRIVNRIAPRLKAWRQRRELLKAGVAIDDMADVRRNSGPFVVGVVDRVADDPRVVIGVSHVSRGELTLKNSALDHRPKLTGKAVGGEREVD